MRERTAFAAAMDELQAAMIVIPSAAYYVPKFTYIWTLGVARFPGPLRKRISRDVALREIARCVPDWRRHHVPRRAGARHWTLSARRRARQPGAGRRRRCRLPGAWRLSAH